MRSVMLSARRQSASSRRATASAVAVGDHQVERGVGERPAAGRGRVGRKGRRGREPVDQRRRAGAPTRSAMRARRPVARRGDGVGIDVAADLAGDVGLARQLQHLRAEGRLERLVLGDVGERVDERDVESDGLAACRIARCRAISARMASVCAACQRLNGSLSVRSRKSRSASARSMSSLHRRREAAQQRRHRPASETPSKTTVWLGFGQLDHVAVDARRR